MERPTFTHQISPLSADMLAGIVTAAEASMIEYTQTMRQHRKHEQECMVRGLPGMGDYHRRQKVAAYREIRSLRKRAARSENV